MKKSISRAEFDRKIKIWSIVVPLIISVIGSITSIVVVYISNQSRPESAVERTSAVEKYQSDQRSVMIDRRSTDNSKEAVKKVEGVQDSLDLERTLEIVMPRRVDSGQTVTIHFRLNPRWLDSAYFDSSFPESSNVEVIAWRRTSVKGSLTSIYLAIVSASVLFFFCARSLVKLALGRMYHRSDSN